MRHRNRGQILGRTRAARRALYRSLMRALLTHGHLTTTLAKAKAVRPLVERVITTGRHGTLTARRRIIAVTGDARLADRVIAVIAPRFRQRPGGYTRLLKLDRRSGDGAPTARLELIAS